MKTSKKKRVPADAAAAPVAAVAEVEAPAAEPVAAFEPTIEAAMINSKPVQADVGPVIALASNCNVKDAAALKSSLCKLAEESAAVGIDVGSLERVDTATLQLLCAFVRDRAARDQKVEWLGDSPALRDAARLLGVTKMLALPPRSQANTRVDTNTLGVAA